ncbi:hypothetical protein B0F90DRAFT_1742452, partial [Multifurca ochricompacta]
KGNLKDGVEVSFGISVLKGTARFYINGGWLWVDLSATVFGTVYGPLKVKLIPSRSEDVAKFDPSLLCFD